jgi:hypothetical protein
VQFEYGAIDAAGKAKVVSIDDQTGHLKSVTTGADGGWGE